jgi:mannose-6-phosphate isomerase-like protein (cupin superfamily)
MKLKPIKHEDDRRVLIEWIDDFPIRNSKILILKRYCELGNHYHNEKIDTFFLLKGSGSYKIGDEYGMIKEGDCFRADVKQSHTFKLKKGSILLEASTTPFNKEDEISIID